LSDDDVTTGNKIIYRAPGVNVYLCCVLHNNMLLVSNMLSDKRIGDCFFSHQLVLNVTNIFWWSSCLNK